MAWALYVLFRRHTRRSHSLTGWLRVAFAAIFAGALASLTDVAQLVSSAGVDRKQLEAQITSSLASFDSGSIAIALSIFGLHLLGLGYLVYRSAFFPRFLGVLVAIAGAGYLIDGCGRILVPDYTWTVGMFAFVGEALLILALLWRAVRGFPSSSALEAEAPLQSPAPVPS